MHKSHARRRSGTANGFKDLVLLDRYATVEAHAIPAMVHFYNESYAN